MSMTWVEYRIRDQIRKSILEYRHKIEGAIPARDRNMDKIWRDKWNHETGNVIEELFKIYQTNRSV